MQKILKRLKAPNENYIFLLLLLSRQQNHLIVLKTNMCESIYPQSILYCLMYLMEKKIISPQL